MEFIFAQVFIGLIIGLISDLIKYNSNIDEVNNDVIDDVNDVVLVLLHFEHNSHFFLVVLLLTLNK